jgi:serralysin
MSGTGNSIIAVTASGNPLIDGLLYGAAWSGTITYAFPDLTSDYTYQTETAAKFAQASELQQKAALFALDQASGNTADDGFSVEGFTEADIDLGSATSANLRLAQSNVPTTSYAYMPGNVAEAGDMWFGERYNYTAPQAGDYAWQTILHEIGHSLGLKHGHEAYGDFPALPKDYDALEYSIMTYRTYVGAHLTGYTYSHWSAPQTFMMADIAALQYMYGADFTTNSGDTTYKWSPDSGDTFVDGHRGIDAGGDQIFATIWDGGGVDTYDLSAYTTDLRLDLRPGQSSTFSYDQLAQLGRNHQPSGNIYNALQYEGDPRSLIENAVGGKGSDRITGNIADNGLRGGSGNDCLIGGEGADKLYGGTGADRLLGGIGDDTLYGRAGNDKIIGGAGNDVLHGGQSADVFVFAKGDGFDRIADFHNGVDTISLTWTAFQNAGDAISHAAQVGNDVVITLSDDQTITIENLKLDLLGSSDFVF